MVAEHRGTPAARLLVEVRAVVAWAGMWAGSELRGSQAATLAARGMSWRVLDNEGCMDGYLPSC